MLINPKFHSFETAYGHIDPLPEDIRYIFNKMLPKKVARGVYLGGLNSFSLCIKDKYVEFPNLGKKTKIMGHYIYFKQSYGLCDNSYQIFKKYWWEIIHPFRVFSIILTPVYRDSQPKQFGFRYHKWGEYIGNQNPKHEYLYDDKHIRKIYSFKIVEIIWQRKVG